MKTFALSMGVAAVLLAACSASDSANSTGSASGGAGTTGAGSPTGTGGATTGNASTGSSFTSGAGGATAGAGGSCAGVTATAQLIPLDMYVMLDSSSSMTDKTGSKGTGPTKWAAITTAIGSFLNDPNSAGLGVGLQFFPIIYPNAPMTCTSQTDCGQYGPCLLKTCVDPSMTVMPCTTSSDCPNNEACQTLGYCSKNTNQLCLYPGSCGALGQCLLLSPSICLNPQSCTVSDYATPAVEIAPLPGSASTLLAAIQNHAPNGNTPTAPALQGAINHSKSWATANSSHKVVAVLATDGLPTSCTPTDIPSIAGIAAAGVSGSPSILTFVIGVFGPGDTASQTNMDQIAKAGGTNAAFIVDTSQDVTTSFQNALNAIRGMSLACDYQVPAAPNGQTLNYSQVNVQYTPPNSSTQQTVYYVGSPDKCDPTTGGWYYDVDPSTGGTPTKIEMCPVTCTQFSTGGNVAIQLGCQTVTPPPK